MKIVLLGSCESRWNERFTEGFKKLGVDVKSFGLASIDPLGHIYYLFRQKTKNYIEEADLIIFTLDDLLFPKNQIILKVSLTAINCVYKILSKLQKKVIVIQWHFSVVFGKYTPFYKIQSEKYGFNFIDAYQFCLKENILDFYINVLSPLHPAQFIFSKMAQVICQNFNSFKKPKKIKNLIIPSFQTLDLDEIIDVKNNENFVKIRSYLCRENVYKLENKKKLKLNLPIQYHGMKIIGVHTWNNCFTSPYLCSYCILENQYQKILIPVYHHEGFMATEYNFTIEKNIEIHNHIDENVKRLKYNVHYRKEWENNKQAGIIGFLLMPKNETLEEAKIPENIDFEISKEYDFTHLCEYLKDYKIIIEQYNLKKDPIKLQALQNQINALNTQISNLNNEKLNLQNKFQNELNSLPAKKQHLELANLEQDLIIKKLESKKLAKSLGIKMSIINPKITFIQANSAKARIQNQLSYKLGQAMIENSKSILGYIRMPYVLSYIKDKHRFEQKAYQEKIKQNPSLKLPPLESYTDYKEALKEKECFTYKLGEALIQANKNWYGGGYLKLFFEIKKLKKEFKNKET